MQQSLDIDYISIRNPMLALSDHLYTAEGWIFSFSKLRLGIVGTQLHTQ